MIDSCENALGTGYRIGDNPCIYAVMSPGRVQAMAAVTADDGLERFEWRNPSCLLLTSEGWLVTGRGKSFGRSQTRIWSRHDYPRFHTGKWLGYWMIEMVGRGGGSLTFGFNSSREMESLSLHLRAM